MAMIYKTKAEIIFDTLREEIVSGVLKPGERLVLNQIAQAMGASEIPVREALKRLQSEGLVVVNPHTGAYVREVSVQDFLEVYDMRAVLEGFAARSTIPHMTQELKQEFNVMFDQMGKSASAGEATVFGRLNKEFHAKLYRVSPNKRLNQLIKRLWVETERARAVFNFYPERIRKAHAEHRQILDAIFRGDEDETERLMRNHKLASVRLIKVYSGRKGDGLSQVQKDFTEFLADVRESK